MMGKLWEDEDSEETKVCSKCSQNKPLFDFGNSNGGNYKRSECRECTRKLRKQVQEISKNIPPPPLDYVCPICERDESLVKGKGGKKTGSWCKDHNHKTGKFRAYICHECNRLLGNCREDKKLLESVQNYLDKHNE
jgi:hypothetical protein